MKNHKISEEKIQRRMIKQKIISDKIKVEIKLNSV